MPLHPPYAMLSLAACLGAASLQAAVRWEDYEALRPAVTGVWEAPPANAVTNNMPHSPLIGNGDIGVVAGTGTKRSAEFTIAKLDFMSKGYNGFPKTGQASTVRVGGVSLTVRGEGETGDYRYEQDPIYGELRLKTATKQQVAFKTFLTRRENLLITEVTALEPAEIIVDTYTFAEGNDRRFPTETRVSGRVAQVTRRAEANKGFDAAAALSTVVVGKTATPVVVNNERCSQTFTLAAGEKVHVVTCVSGGGWGKDNQPYADTKLRPVAEKLATLNPKACETHYLGSREFWKRFAMKSYVDFHDNLVNRYWYQSQYMLAGASTPGGVCAGIYGPYVTTDTPMYQNDIHLNYNGQSPFWGAASSNHPELVLPLVDLLDGFIPLGEDYAANHCGKIHPSQAKKKCKGILFTVGVNQQKGVISETSLFSQTLNAAFGCLSYIDYYESTKDADFLRRHAYPYVSRVADFYATYMDKEKTADGYRYSIHSGAHEGTWDKNSPSDLGFAKQALSHAIRYAKTLNVDRDKVAVWDDVLRHLATYTVRPSPYGGENCLWFSESSDFQRHNGNITILNRVHPAETEDLLSDEATLKLLRTTFKWHIKDPGAGGYGNMNNFPMAFTIGARIGWDADDLWNNFTAQLRQNLKPNGYVNDNHHGIEKAGATEYLNNTMLQSTRGVIQLFPAWPKQRQGRFENLRARGAFLVSAAFEAGAVADSVTILSEKGSDCVVRKPWSGPVAVSDAGAPVPFTVKDDLVTFRTSPNHTYVVKKAIR